MTEQLMRGFPSSTDNQVTLANWRQAPWSQWAFHHVRELLPTAGITTKPGNTWALDEDLVNLGGISIDLADGDVMSVAGLIESMHIDAMLVLHRDRIVYEHYQPGMDRYRQHILFSISKSVLGMVCAVLDHEQRLDINREAVAYVAELETTAYRDCTIRQLLDMRVPVAFDEDYLATTGAIIDYRKAAGWNPPAGGEQPYDLRSFYQTLTDTLEDYSGEFFYASPNTDLLAWIIERACNQPYAEILSETLWQPMGAECNAYITVDRLGAPRAAGGLCTTLRDLARIGRLIANQGKRGDIQVLPEQWTERLLAEGDQDAWSRGSFANKFPGIPISYRNKWYVTHPHPADESHWYMALGIHGQNIYVDTNNEFVMVKFSSSPQALSDSGPMHGLLAARAIRDYLVNHF